MRILSRSVVGLIGLVIVVTGCDESAPGEPSLQVKVSALAACPESENGNQQIPEDADRVVVRLSEGPISVSAPIFTTILVDDPGPTGKVEIPDVPEGSGIRLDAVACNSDDEATWSGSSFGISVQAGLETPVDLF
ncbi:MAG: hypothetical protein VYE15_03700, partial [Myxococcota bacterium]|nr:hypothetical protein [Myxococcota bacterium]